MQFVRQNKRFLAHVFSALAPIFLTFPVVAQDGDRSVDTTTRAVQAWGQVIIDRKLAQLQQNMAAEVLLQYETELAQRSSSYMDQLAVALDVDMEPVILPAPSEMLANVALTGDEGGCAY